MSKALNTSLTELKEAIDLFYTDERLDDKYSKIAGEISVLSSLIDNLYNANTRPLYESSMDFEEFISKYYKRLPFKLDTKNTEKSLIKIQDIALAIMVKVNPQLTNTFIMESEKINASYLLVDLINWLEDYLEVDRNEFLGDFMDETSIDVNLDQWHWETFIKETFL